MFSSYLLGLRSGPSVGGVGGAGRQREERAHTQTTRTPAHPPSRRHTVCECLAWLSDSEIVCVSAASRATASLLTQHLSA